MSISPSSVPTIAHRVVALLVANGVAKLLIVGLEVLISIYEGAAQLGLFATCLSILLLTGLLAMLGTDFAVIRFLAIAQEDGDHLRVRRLIQANLAIVSLVGVAFGAIIIVATDWIASSAFGKPGLHDALIWIGLAIPFEAINQGSGAIFRGLRRERDYVMTTDLLRAAIMLALVISSSWLRSDIARLSAALFAATAASSVYGLTAVRRHLPARTGQATAVAPSLTAVATSLLRFASVVYVWNVLQRISGYSLVLIGSIFLASTDVGVLNLFQRVALVLTFFQSAINNTAPVEFSRLHHLGDLSGLRDLFRDVTRGLALVSVLLVVPVIADPSSIVGWIGPPFLASAALLVPLLAAQAVNVGTGPIGQLLLSCAYRREMLIVSSVGAGLHIGLAIVLIPRFGIKGAIAGEVVTIFSMMVMRQFCGWWRLRIHAFSGWLLGLFVTAFLSAYVARALGSWSAGQLDLDLSLPMGVAIAIVICGLFGRGWAASRSSALAKE